MTLAELNSLPQPAFVAALGTVFEHSPWVAERACEHRPFATVDALHQAMIAAVLRSPEKAQLDLVRAHPELAGAEAKAGTLTAHSTSEQARLGLTRLSPEELRRLEALNRAYRERFGFPCIVALRLHASRASVLAEMERRLENTLQQELETAVEQIGHIARGRLEKILA